MSPRYRAPEARNEKQNTYNDVRKQINEGKKNN